MSEKEPPPFQFRLSSALLALTIACVVFAALGQLGVEGLLERVGVALTVAGIFAPLIDFYRWWKSNVEFGD